MSTGLAILTGILAGMVPFAVGFLVARDFHRAHLACMHHDPKGGWEAGVPEKATSYVKARMINMGAGKLFICGKCGKGWTV